MKRRDILAVALILLTALFTKLEAQTSEKDVPRILSYQGQITTANGTAMNGTHKITATLYSDHLGRNSVWQGSYNAEISNSIFTVKLGFGAQKLPDNSAMEPAALGWNKSR